MSSVVGYLRHGRSCRQPVSHGGRKGQSGLSPAVTDAAFPTPDYFGLLADLGAT